jgi:hypothetical protein
VKHSLVLELLAHHPEPRNYSRSGAKEIRPRPIVGGRQFRMRRELVRDRSSAMQPQHPFSWWYLSWMSVIDNLAC